jgi:hypothetical protein
MLRKILLGCGIASSVLYVASDILISWWDPNYSYRDQSFSELLAPGSPTRPLVLVLLAIPYGWELWSAATSTPSCSGWLCWPLASCAPRSQSNIQRQPLSARGAQGCWTWATQASENAVTAKFAEFPLQHHLRSVPPSRGSLSLPMPIKRLTRDSTTQFRAVIRLPCCLHRKGEAR